MTRDEARKKLIELTKDSGCAEYRLAFERGFLACYDWMASGEADAWVCQSECGYRQVFTGKQSASNWKKITKREPIPVKLIELTPPKEEE